MRVYIRVNSERLVNQKMNQLEIHLYRAIWLMTYSALAAATFFFPLYVCL